jgi:biotin transporter BioY
VPFIFVDLVKAAAVASISSALLPKTSYQDEREGLNYGSGY